MRGQRLPGTGERAAFTWDRREQRLPGTGERAAFTWDRREGGVYLGQVRGQCLPR